MSDLLRQSGPGWHVASWQLRLVSALPERRGSPGTKARGARLFATPVAIFMIALASRHVGYDSVADGQHAKTDLFVPLKPIVILLSTPLPAVLPKIILVPPVPPLDIAPVVTALAGMSLPTMA